MNEFLYCSPRWSDIKPGVFLLVRFDGNRKTNLKYVCFVCDVDEEDGEITVQGFRKYDKIGSQFEIKENDESSIDCDMVCAILPNPKFVESARKIIYQFPGYVKVNEN